MPISEIVLLLLIINLGTAFGAGLYETRIVLPLWFSETQAGEYSVNFEAMRAIDTGRKFWGMITTVPLTLLTIANLILALQSDIVTHNWWLASAFILLLERIGTFAFFIPTAIRLQKGENLPAKRIAGLVSWWIGMNYVRIVLMLAAWVLALKVLMM